jgi:hypothetical protein
MERVFCKRKSISSLCVGRQWLSRSVWSPCWDWFLHEETQHAGCDPAWDLTSISRDQNEMGVWAYGCTAPPDHGGSSCPLPNTPHPHRPGGSFVIDRSLLCSRPDGDGHKTWATARRVGFVPGPIHNVHLSHHLSTLSLRCVVDASFVWWGHASMYFGHQEMLWEGQARAAIRKAQ